MCVGWLVVVSFDFVIWCIWVSTYLCCFCFVGEGYFFILLDGHYSPCNWLDDLHHNYNISVGRLSFFGIEYNNVLRCILHIEVAMNNSF